MITETLDNLDTSEFEHDDAALAELEQLYGISSIDLNN